MSHDILMDILFLFIYWTTMVTIFVVSEDEHGV